MDSIEWDIENPLVKELIEAARIMHWGSISIGLALGLRAGIKAMGALELQRKQADRVNVRGSYCFAQGVEVITGCSMLRGKMAFAHSTGGDALLDLWGQGKHIRIKPNNMVSGDGRQIMNARESDIFEDMEIVKL
jgi:formylmethanofuran dehydrogenase subunit E